MRETDEGKRRRQTSGNGEIIKIGRVGWIGGEQKGGESEREEKMEDERDERQSVNQSKDKRVRKADR